MLARLLGKSALGLDVAGFSDAGHVRGNNEDYWVGLSAADAPDGCSGILIVADGMGGHLAGEVASRMAVGEAMHALRCSRFTWLETLRRLFREVNRDIFAAGQRAATVGMGTTLTIAVQTGRYLFVGHVGDTRLYVIRRRELTRITSDHNMTAAKLAAGVITLDEASQDPQRNVLTRVIGAAPEVECDIYEIPIERGDRLLACSDGLYGELEDSDILYLARRGNPSHASKALVSAANNAGGTDNITAAIADVIPVRPRVIGTRPQVDDEVTIDLELGSSVAEMTSARGSLTHDIVMPLIRSRSNVQANEAASELAISRK